MTSKTVLGIAIVAVIALGAIFALRAHAPSESSNGEAATLPTSPNDTSDAALQQDTAAVDAQLSGVDSDTATVNQGISETQY